MASEERDAETARLIVKHAAQFAAGCGNAGPDLGTDSAGCPECVALFLAAVRRALADP